MHRYPNGAARFQVYRWAMARLSTACAAVCTHHSNVRRVVCPHGCPLPLGTRYQQGSFYPDENETKHARTYGYAPACPPCVLSRVVLPRLLRAHGQVRHRARPRRRRGERRREVTAELPRVVSVVSPQVDGREIHGHEARRREDPIDRRDRGHGYVVYPDAAAREELDGLEGVPLARQEPLGVHLVFNSGGSREADKPARAKRIRRRHRTRLEKETRHSGVRGSPIGRHRRR